MAACPRSSACRRSSRATRPARRSTWRDTAASGNCPEIWSAPCSSTSSLEDEERHHALLRRMAARLGDDIEMTRSTSALPSTAPPTDTSATILALTREYAEDEHKGAGILRDLAKHASGLYGGVFSLLLETMARDSEKHERIMRFILQRLSDSRRRHPALARSAV